MKIIDVCKARSISPGDITTPLLLPSFSSRGFPNLSRTYTMMAPYITEAVLVSAYDIHWGLLRNDNLYSSDVIFVDSGGYEANPLTDTSEGYVDLRQSQGWCLNYYHAVLDRLQPLSQLVVVSYDHEVRKPLIQQIQSACALLEAYPKYAFDFLYKPPECNTYFIDIDALISNIRVVSPFSILGIAEKELGNSLFARCKSILRIRCALQACGLDKPIHIFGCLDPFSILAYFLCGADIFDGLAWLRFAFIRGVPVYHGAATLLQQKWNYDDGEVILAQWIQNLQALKMLREAMITFTQTGSIDELRTWGQGLRQILSLVTVVGLEMEGDGNGW